jgi:hypothetical protein
MGVIASDFGRNMGGSLIDKGVTPSYLSAKAGRFGRRPLIARPKLK